MNQPVLLVNPDRDNLAIMAAFLRASGYDPTLTDDFEDATALLKAGGFAMLITAERLGAHNGLHLVLRARAGRPTMGTVVTVLEPDPVVEAEATLFGAVCVVSPWEYPVDLLAALTRAERAQPA
jgi:DNA-binding NtrC family response regulator